jgi:hypothetical protein
MDAGTRSGVALVGALAMNFCHWKKTASWLDRTERRR